MAKPVRAVPKVITSRGTARLAWVCVGATVYGVGGFGHHNTMPINFYDRDGDGALEQGELRLGSQRVSPYLYVGITPVTFVRLVGRQWLLRGRGGA